MRLSHNIASLEIYRNHTKVIEKQSTAINRISSGYKVNNAKDDPNIIAQSERMRIQIRGLQMAGRNTQDGVSMLQTAEGGLDGITQMLQRIRELSVQAGSGANTAEDKQTIQNEISQMIDGIEQIANNTEFNGLKLLNSKDKTPLKMPIGANADENVEIPQFSLTPSEIPEASSDKLKSIDIVNNPIDKALEVVDKSLDQISSVRSKYGAIENRFEGTLQDISEISIKIEGADSNLRDADIALEMMELAKNNLLAEAGNAMMVQTNKFPQDALRVLENVKSR